MASLTRAVHVEEALAGYVPIDIFNDLVVDSGGAALTATHQYWDNGDSYQLGAAITSGSQTITAKTIKRLPVEFVANGDLQVRVTVGLTGAPSGAKTVDVQVFKADGAGSVVKSGGTPIDLCATAAQNIDTTQTEYTFNVTTNDGTAPLVAGSDVVVVARVSVTHTGSSLQAKLSKMGLLHDVKG